MNTLTRWNQLRQLEALQHGLGSLFNRSPGQWSEGQEEPMAVAEWAPLVDISEDDKEEKGKKYHRVERAYGNFVRNFSLPDDASPAHVSAEFKDGVLTVRLAKTAKAKPQQIEVKMT